MNLKKLVLSTLLILSASVYADTIGFGNNIPGNDPWGNQNYERDVELQLNRYFEGQSRLNLLQDSYIRAQLQGKRIKEITITASSEAGNGQMRLLVNQRSNEGARTISRQLGRYSFQVDPNANSINQNLRALEIEMRGRLYVEKVVFNMLQNNTPNYPDYPGPGTPSRPQVDVVRQQFNETIQQEGGLNLFRNFNLALERQGQTLSRVTVLARSQRGHSQGQLLINEQGSSEAQLIGTSSTRLSFELNGQRIGREIQALRLQFRGYLIVEEVTLEFVRAGSSQPIPGPGPISERRIEQTINQRIYDTSGVSLINLMRIDRRHENRIVDSVEIYLRDSQYGVNLKLCQQVLTGPYQSVTCATNTMVTPGMRVVRLNSLNYAKLAELSLSVRMGMIDIDKMAINFR